MAFEVDALDAPGSSDFEERKLRKVKLSKIHILLKYYNYLNF
jgi:hypothetical protein